MLSHSFQVSKCEHTTCSSLTHSLFPCVAAACVQNALIIGADYYESEDQRAKFLPDHCSHPSCAHIPLVLRPYVCRTR
jgi:hypothetical protein